MRHSHVRSINKRFLVTGSKIGDRRGFLHGGEGGTRGGQGQVFHVNALGQKSGSGGGTDL
jgi:hypothetical protein